METHNFKTELGKQFYEKLNQEYLTTLDNKKYVNKNYNLNNYRRDANDITEIIVHCTATDSKLWDNVKQCIDYDLKPNHISKKGCPTCTYHFYIDQQGEVDQPVSIYIKTFNCKNHNDGYIAICINNGGEKSDVIEKEQYESLVDTICYVFDFMDWKYTEEELKDKVNFHRDFANKLCPGENLNKEKLLADCLVRFKDWGDVV